MGAHGYRRILLKLSGEVLMGDQAYGIDPDTVARVAEEVKAAQDTGLQLCLVIGGGNIFRGMSGAAMAAPDIPRNILPPPMTRHNCSPVSCAAFTSSATRATVSGSMP